MSRSWPLVATAGAGIPVHREAKPSCEHEQPVDGHEIELTALMVRALHAPRSGWRIRAGGSGGAEQNDDYDNHSDLGVLRPP
jgi:hypothetical protein